PALLQPGEDYVWPQLSDDGRYVAAIYSESEPRPDSVLDREAGDGVWRAFLLGLPAIVNGFFDRNDYLAIVADEQTPRGALARIPLDGSAWTELVAEGDAVMRSVQRAGDLLVLHELLETRSRLRLLTPDGEPVGEVPLPPDSAAGG